MFKQSRTFRLPTFPPRAASHFRRLCEALPPHTVPQLREELEGFYDGVLREVDERPLVNRELVRELYDRASLLLDRYPHLSERHRSLVVGALRYFVSGDDSFSDLDFASGFNDDAEVMNYVLEELGLIEEAITVEWAIK
jgi:hypothetical protein